MYCIWSAKDKYCNSTGYMRKELLSSISKSTAYGLLSLLLLVALLGTGANTGFVSPTIPKSLSDKPDMLAAWQPASQSLLTVVEHEPNNDSLTLSHDVVLMNTMTALG
ncbi:hypothetical protein JHK85_050385 [Glycine max]|nr:hypothetical protein JHK85_050385 [Glycine max]